MMTSIKFLPQIQIQLNLDDYYAKVAKQKLHLKSSSGNRESTSQSISTFIPQVSLFKEKNFRTKNNFHSMKKGT